MSDDIDFSEIDQIMADMEDDSKFVKSVAADVAKAEPVVKTAVKKPKTAKKSAAKPAKKSPAKKPKPSPDNDKGETVLVKILSKPALEDAEPEIKPNPKTGKYMDLVNPLSDMSIQGNRPNNPLPEIIIPPDEDEDIEPATVSIGVITVSESDDEEPDEGPTVGDMIDEYESTQAEESDDEPDEPEPDQADDTDEPEFETEVADDVETEPEIDQADDEPSQREPDEFDQLADELAFSDLDTPFLENVTVEKRPLGGGDPIEKVNLGDPISEQQADQDFVANKTDSKWLKTESPKSAKTVEPKNSPVDAPAVKPAKPHKSLLKILLNILLIILLIGLGGSIGALIYFSM